MKTKVFSFHCKKILFGLPPQFLIFLYYDVFFNFTERNLLGDTEKLLNLQDVMGQCTIKSFFGELLKISLEGHGCPEKVGYLPENLRI